MTVFGLHFTIPVLWLVLAVIFLIIEALTVGLTTICLLLFTRKIFIEKLRTGAESTNIDAVIGEVGQVTVRIEPFEVGQVKLKGQVWSATCEENITLAEDSLVKVEGIEGVKLIVSPFEEN